MAHTRAFWTSVFCGFRDGVCRVVVPPAMRKTHIVSMSRLVCRERSCAYSLYTACRSAIFRFFVPSSTFAASLRHFRPAPTRALDLLDDAPSVQANHAVSDYPTRSGFSASLIATLLFANWTPLPSNFWSLIVDPFLSAGGFCTNWLWAMGFLWPIPYFWLLILHWGGFHNATVGGRVC